ncbi:hypothetical protein BDP27DRAFT_1430305 [Rhodocollybia butyracea]|uniref:Uncharacterized protein n=1 Tax=Rhodocollybia butyracea TaxID=206335 RepID=A0A9P5U077_9AGAR|nr:hypothetical protein BDP27DRAFT_1430305 [Rhodocollybia butyracea]
MLSAVVSTASSPVLKNPVVVSPPSGSIVISDTIPPTLTDVQDPSSSKVGKVKLDLGPYNACYVSLLSSYGLLVTTPNMMFIPAPITCCGTCLHRLSNFGKDDPCCWPQPFHRTIGHLAIIPAPNDSSTHPLRFAWYHLAPRDYLPVEVPGLVGVIHISDALVHNVHSMCMDLCNTV